MRHHPTNPQSQHTNPRRSCKNTPTQGLFSYIHSNKQHDIRHLTQLWCSGSRNGTPPFPPAELQEHPHSRFVFLCPSSHITRCQTSDAAVGLRRLHKRGGNYLGTRGSDENMGSISHLAYRRSLIPRTNLEAFFKYRI